MTEFEQRVAEALRPLLSDGTRNYLDDCPLLGPRVAAAITAARVSGLAGELLPACDAAVFAALRGEQS